MDNRKFSNLMKDESFLKKILVMKTPEEVQAAFKGKGVEISLEEIELLGDLINKSIEKGGKKLTEDDLHEIVGGDGGIDIGKAEEYMETSSDSKSFAAGIGGGLAFPFIGPGLAVAGAIKGDSKAFVAGVGLTIGFAGTIAASIGIYEGIKWGSKKIISTVKKRKNRK